MKMLIVTGRSGSRKSVALNTLEDLGYYCIDNLPVYLLTPLAQHILADDEQSQQVTCVGIDARGNTESLQRLPGVIEQLRESGVHCDIIFLEAQSDVLIKRFNETRRKHPLSSDERPLTDAMELEPFDSVISETTRST